MSTHGLVEFPHKVDLVKDLYRPFPIISRLPTDASDKASDLVENILVKLGCAMEKNDVSELSSLFFTDQAYWRDTLALTYHLRTDELLLQLKGEGLSWDEISGHFPERSKGTLQVHYSTKLTRRSETSKMMRKRRRNG